MKNKKEIIKKIFLIVSLGGIIISLIWEELYERQIINFYLFYVKAILFMMFLIAIPLNIPSD